MTAPFAPQLTRAEAYARMRHWYLSYGYRMDDDDRLDMLDKSAAAIFPNDPAKARELVQNVIWGVRE